MKTIYQKLIATCALLGIAASAHAQLYITTGSTGVTTHFTFDFNPTLNQVSVLVDNTHPGVGGATASLTSFGFNLPTALVGTGALLITSGVPAGTWNYFSPYSLNNFDQDNGAGNGANLNGGQPNQGVLFGTTASFVFQYDDFATTTGFLGENGVSAKWQAVNTTGSSDEGFGNPGDLLTPVPEPSTYGLIGAAVLMLGVVVRRKLRRATPALAA